MPGKPTEARSASGNGATSLARSAISFSGERGYVVGIFTRSATMAPSASSTDAFRPVPPMSMAKVKGCLGSALGVGIAVELEVFAELVMPTRYAHHWGCALRSRPDRRRWSALSSALPVVVVEDLLQRQPAPPPVALEVGHGLDVADRPDAQPGNRADAFGNSKQIAQERLPVEGDPAHAQALGRAGQPQVLDGQAHRVDAGVGYGVAPENGW